MIDWDIGFLTKMLITDVGAQCSVGDRVLARHDLQIYSHFFQRITLVKINLSYVFFNTSK